MKKNYLFTIISILFWLPLWAQTATVTLTSEKQVIKGFGGINHPVWYTDLNASERNLCFGNGDGQIGLTVLRIWVSDNPNQWALDLATAKRAIELGAIVFATPWNPPSNMREAFGTYSDGKTKYRLEYSEYANYAKHLNDFVTYMRNNGVELYAISTQNEPDYAHDWTEWTPQESLNFIKNHADKIDCRIMTPESFQYRKSVYDPILNDPVALSKIDVFGTHLYGTLVKDFPYPLFKQKGAGKELWMTEVYTDSENDANLWNLAMDAAVHIHNAMVEGEFQAYVWWPLRRYYALIHDGVGGHNNSNVAAAGTITKRGYVFAQFSKFVRPGYVRVDATKSPTTDVYVSAYKKGDDVVLVLVNKSTSSKTITLNIPNTKVQKWDKYVTSGSKNVVKEASVNTTSSTFSVTIDAQSITTFDGKAVSGLPTVTFTSPATNDVFLTTSTIPFVVSATSPNGTISRIDFYDGANLVHQEYVAPYEFNLQNLTEGKHTIKAIVTDNAGKTSETSIVLQINVPQGPFKGTIHTIPGRIEAEDYDVGGEGFAFHEADTLGNQGGSAYRNDAAVDIETTADVSGAYNVGYILNGEWLEYTVDVTKSGFYDLDIRLAANGDGRTMHIEMDNVDITGAIAVPNTAGWQTWQTFTLPKVNLTQGTHVMKVAFDANYMNFNYLEFKSIVTGSETSKNTEIDVFPNPFSQDGLRITAPDHFKYTITNSVGLVQEEGTGFETLQIGKNLENGVYVLTIESNGISKTQKIIKK